MSLALRDAAGAGTGSMTVFFSGAKEAAWMMFLYILKFSGFSFLDYLSVFFASWDEDTTGYERLGFGVLMNSASIILLLSVFRWAMFRGLWRSLEGTLWRNVWHRVYACYAPLA
jgi:hypothetical protein